MSKRNLAWLTTIIVVGAVLWIAAGLVFGLLAAAATLIVSEVVERRARAHRRAASGAQPGPPVADVVDDRPAHR